MSHLRSSIACYTDYQRSPLMHGLRFRLPCDDAQPSATIGALRAKRAGIDPRGATLDGSLMKTRSSMSIRSLLMGVAVSALATNALAQTPPPADAPPPHPPASPA